MGEYDFILDQMIFSYSRLETCERCPQCFYLTYILKKKSTDGAFGQYGSFGHELLEDYFKNKLCSFELKDKYVDEFTSKVTAYFPPNKYVDLAAKYFEQGKEYFSDFNGLDDCYEVLDVEHKYDYKIDKYDFTGVVDLELKNKNGWFEIVDHKSKSEQDKTQRQVNNAIKKGENKEDFVELTDGRFLPFSMVIQLYLYCIPFYEKYGEYPKYLNFNMFKIKDWYKFEFNKDDFERSKNWVINTIANIYNEVKWLKGEEASEFWCSWVCGQNRNCQYSERYIGE